MINKNLGKRLLFVLWAIPLSWAIIASTFDLSTLLPGAMTHSFSPITLLTILIILIMTAALGEYTHMLSKEFPNNKFWLMYFWFIPSLFNDILVEPLFEFKEREHIFLLILFVAAEVVFVGKGDKRWRRASMLFSGTLFFYLAGIFMLSFQGETFSSLWDFPDKWYCNGLGIIITLTAVFMCDSMAYFTGMLFGKHKLSSISPKKTVEGSIGGLVASIVIMTIGLSLWGSDKAPAFLGPLLGLAIGVSAQVGDLAMSVIKRYFDVKDSSNLIPGHGGVLDRFDSLFFAAPIIHSVISFSLKLSSH